jgi:hypothetical protein
MNTYQIAVSMLVSVEAPTEKDALEAVEDSFGLGDFCGVVVKDKEVELIDAE